MRTVLSDRKLPNYSHGEELFNMISHIVGGAMGILVLVFCIIVAALHNNVFGVVSSAIYGASMILLYSMSSIYHGLTNQTAKKVFQVLDHCAIYLLIAGTYTPIALSAIRPHYPALGWMIFGLEWALAALSITLTAIDLKRYQVFSMICYLLMGWMIIFFVGQVIVALSIRGFLFILAGGILYTIGAVLYNAGKKRPYAHGVFHLFVLLGSLAQFFGILLWGL